MVAPGFNPGKMSETNKKALPMRLIEKLTLQAPHNETLFRERWKRKIKHKADANSSGTEFGCRCSFRWEQ